MKKALSIILCAALIFALAACGQESGTWTRSGYFSDDTGCMLSITYMEDVTDPGWYVGFMAGEDLVDDSFGGTLAVKKDSLQGKLTSAATDSEITVTVKEEGEEGVLLKTKDGKEYHFVPMVVPEPLFKVTLDTEGMGGVAYAAGTEDPQYDVNEPYQWAQFGIFDENSATYTFEAYEHTEEYHFVKWKKNGEDFTTERRFTATIDADTTFTAVFE